LHHSVARKWIRTKVIGADFTFRYKLKEIRRHGEAGSVDAMAVEKERIRLRELFASFPPKDRWNVDETALFPFAPPDRGLSSEQMSGTKASKFDPNHFVAWMQCRWFRENRGFLHWKIQEATLLW
jgi:hypothetical protein